MCSDRAAQSLGSMKEDVWCAAVSAPGSFNLHFCFVSNYDVMWMGSVQLKIYCEAECLLCFCQVVFKHWLTTSSQQAWRRWVLPLSFRLGESVFFSFYNQWTGTQFCWAADCVCAFLPSFLPPRGACYIICNRTMLATQFQRRGGHRREDPTRPQRARLGWAWLMFPPLAVSQRNESRERERRGTTETGRSRAGSTLACSGASFERRACC